MEAGGSEAFVEPSSFWICVLVAAAVGVYLALLDDHELKDVGNNPTSHLSACADSADALFNEYWNNGLGLGILVPLWQLFTPDGALWTLVTGWYPSEKASPVGLRGLADAASSLVNAMCRATALIGGVLLNWLRPRHNSQGANKNNKPGDASIPSRPEMLDMSFYVELHAYWGYLCLFVMGVVREHALRVCATLFRMSIAHQYVTREQWNVGWVEFYFQHMFKNIGDCFSRPIASAPDACIEVIKRKRRGGFLFGPLYEYECTAETQTCVNLSSYNYLGFGGVDAFCTPVAHSVAVNKGFSAGGTRTEGGTRPVHLELEQEVAKFLEKEDAMVLGMGFATNSTILPALLEATAGGSGVLVLSDKLNHRSIVEGVRLSGATVRAWEHNCMQALEGELIRATKEGQSNGKPWRKIFIVVEGIYSMEGDFCRLREIVTLKNRYKAYLYLDEAHSIGAVGPRGRGVTDLLGVPTAEVEVMMGTFTKSFGSAGGYVAASKPLLDALRCNAPGSVFAGAMAPPCAAQALAALRVITGSVGGAVGQQKLECIRDNSNFFRQALVDAGFKVLGDEDSPIIPVMLHHPAKMAKFSRMCLEKGVAVVIVGYPAVPLLYERVRFCISAAHTREQLAKVIDELTDIGKKIGVLFEKGVPAEAAAERAVEVRKYHAWLRNAPIESRQTPPATAALHWFPEPLVPTSVSERSNFDEVSLLSATSIDPDSAVDFRAFDPLGYMRQPPSSAQHAVQNTMALYGFGACGPRGFYGTTKPHIELEIAIKNFLGVEAAITYSAGVTTVSSTIPALVQPGDCVIVDTEAHLGIRTGLRLCRADITWVPHGDVAAFDAALSKAQLACADKQKRESKKQRTFIIVEGICQRTGRLAPLERLVAMKDKYGALLVLDETLSFGALGTHGRGLCEQVGLSTTNVDVIMGSLEHAVAGVGGFCAGHRTLVEHQRLAGAGYCFSASCPPAACSAAVAMLGEMGSESGAARLAGLGSNATFLHEILKKLAMESDGRLQLLSSPNSYVKHLRWGVNGENGEEQLLSIAKSCSPSIRMQICSPGSNRTEQAFGSRINAPHHAPHQTASSMRLCVSVEHSAADLTACGAALHSVLMRADQCGQAHV